MDPLIISFVLNGILGVAMFFMKQTHDATKEEIRTLKIDLRDVRDRAFLKEDFHDFRNQLWGRLDKMEADFKQQLMGFQK